ncbi:MAG: hypothetical protein R3B46_10210 [Phycisphaerales bacterium]
MPDEKDGDDEEAGEVEADTPKSEYVSDESVGDDGFVLTGAEPAKWTAEPIS